MSARCTGAETRKRLDGPREAGEDFLFLGDDFLGDFAITEALTEPASERERDDQQTGTRRRARTLNAKEYSRVTLSLR